jgi:hypothetical protein
MHRLLSVMVWAILFSLLPGCVWVTGRSDYEATLRDASRVGVRSERNVFIPLGAAQQGEGVFKAAEVKKIIETTVGDAAVAAKITQGLDAPDPGRRPTMTLMDKDGIPRYKLEFQRAPNAVSYSAQICVDPSRKSPPCSDGQRLWAGPC